MFRMGIADGYKMTFPCVYVCVRVFCVRYIYIKEKYDKYNKGIRLYHGVIDKTGINSIESCDTPRTNETNLL